MKKIARLYILLSWAVFVLIMISFPTPPYEGTVISWHDKVFHILLFGVFTYLLVYYLLTSKIPFFIILVISSLLSISYSIGGEYLQNFIPGRTVSIYDFYAGLVGIFIATVISYARFKPKKI
jgi:VanZ family protein